MGDGRGPTAIGVPGATWANAEEHAMRQKPAMHETRSTVLFSGSREPGQLASFFTPETHQVEALYRKMRGVHLIDASPCCG